jgi:hypothetical protein
VIDRADKETLLANPAFQRFMFWLVQAGGVFDDSWASADHRYLDGRRGLAIEVLREFEAVQPTRHPSGIPVATSIQLFREAVQTAVKNTQPGRSGTYDELRDNDG